MNPFRWARKHVYEGFYLRELEYLMGYVGGRAQSGKVGSRARFLRITVNLIGIVAILGSILLDGGFTASAFVAFWNSGAHLQSWALSTTLMCMGVNMGAVLFGTAANFTKIQQYTHAELTLQELINEKKQKNGHKIPNRFPVSWQKRLMLFIRYSHDFNGFTGSGISAYLFLACAMNIFFPGTLSLSLPMYAILFCASRLSSLISVIFAPLTNQFRLLYYKGRIQDQIKEYYAEHAIENAPQSKLIHQLMDAIFRDQQLIAKIPKQYELVRLACYRACERHDMKLLSKHQSNIEIAINGALIQHFQQRQSAGNAYGFIPISAIEDTYMITALIDSEIKAVLYPGNKASELKYPLMRRYPECLLAAEIKSRITPDNAVKINSNMTTSPYLIQRESQYLIKTSRVKKDFPLPLNPHGAELVPGDQCRRIADAICRA